MSNIAKPTTAIAPAKSSIELLPIEFQAAVRFFYGFYSDTLRGTTGIATRLRWWILEDGITLAEAKQAMKSLMSPERSAEIATSPQALAALSAEIGVIIKTRRSREATDRRRAEAERDKQQADDPARIKEMLATAFKP